MDGIDGKNPAMETPYYGSMTSFKPMPEGLWRKGDPYNEIYNSCVAADNKQGLRANSCENGYPALALCEKRAD